MISNLRTFVAAQRLAIFERLKAGLAPEGCEFEQAALQEARTKGAPQMGSTVYRPDQIRLEFIYSDPQGGTMVFVVCVTPPERIVALPVPAWVVENIWQGEVHGSHAFESEAYALLEAFRASLEPGPNAALFEAAKPIGRS